MEFHDLWVCEINISLSVQIEIENFSGMSNLIVYTLRLKVATNFNFRLSHYCGDASEKIAISAYCPQLYLLRLQWFARRYLGPNNSVSVLRVEEFIRQKASGYGNSVI